MPGTLTPNTRPCVAVQYLLDASVRAGVLPDVVRKAAEPHRLDRPSRTVDDQSFVDHGEGRSAERRIEHRRAVVDHRRPRLRSGRSLETRAVVEPHARVAVERGRPVGIDADQVECGRRHVLDIAPHTRYRLTEFRMCAGPVVEARLSLDARCNTNHLDDLQHVDPLPLERITQIVYDPLGPGEAAG